MQSSSSEREAVTAGVLVLKYVAGELRVAMSRDPERGPDAWVIPKGHIRDGESVEGAALREASEETGASDLVLVTYLGSFCRRSLEDWGEWVQKTIHLFLGYSFGSSEIRPDSFETLVESSWLRVDEAIEKVPWTEDRAFLKKHFEVWLSH